MTLKYTKGFSLIDLLVSISITTLLMSVVLFSYRTFQNKLAVSSAAQEIAVATRQAQTYSLNVRQTSTGSGSFSSGYGVYFDTQTPGTYYVFADKNHDCKYTGDSTCSPSSECVKKETLKNNVGISTLCGLDASGVQTCFPSGTSVSVVYPPSNFQSSNADACISFADNNGNAVPGTYATAKVIASLKDALTQTVQSSVSLSRVGQIYVQPTVSSPTNNYPPFITLVGGNPINAQTGSTYVDPGAIATDQEDGDLTSHIVTTGTVNSMVPGTYTLTYNVQDSQGFPATPVTRTVVVSSTCNPTLVGSVASVGSRDSNVSLNGYTYVVNSTNGTLKVIDVSTPSHPTVVGSVSTGSGPHSLAVKGNYVYVLNTTDNTLQVFDVSTPSNPTSVATVGTNTTPQGIEIQGNYAYVINANSNTLQVFDISTPSLPTLAGSVGTDNGPVHLTISGSYVYVITVGSNTLEAFNISTPSTPTLAGSVSISYGPYDIAVKGNYAYVIHSFSNTLEVFDISTPSHPVSVATVNTARNPTSVAINGNKLYVTNTYVNVFGVYVNDNNLKVYDISIPTSPTNVGTVVTDKGPYDVSILNNYGYVTNSTGNSLQAFNLACGISQ